MLVYYPDIYIFVIIHITYLQADVSLLNCSLQLEDLDAYTELRMQRKKS
jgi:hypothetical protein